MITLFRAVGVVHGKFFLLTSTMIFSIVTLFLRMGGAGSYFFFYESSLFNFLSIVFLKPFFQPWCRPFGWWGRGSGRHCLSPIRTLSFFFLPMITFFLRLAGAEGGKVIVHLHVNRYKRSCPRRGEGRSSIGNTAFFFIPGDNVLSSGSGGGGGRDSIFLPTKFFLFTMLGGGDG